MKTKEMFSGQNSPGAAGTVIWLILTGTCAVAMGTQRTKAKLRSIAKEAA